MMLLQRCVTEIIISMLRQVVANYGLLVKYKKEKISVRSRPIFYNLTEQK